MFKEMKAKDIKALKEVLWERNNKKCPVLNKEIPLEKMVLDHAHKNSTEEYSETKGVVREALDFRVNAVLGKLENALKRTGLDKEEDFNIGDFLRRAAEYFDRGAYVDEDGFMYVHPTEVKKEKNVSKRNYNKLKRLYLQSGARKAFPDYPKSSKLTKPLAELFEKFGISPW